jgi:hypothetical protein
MKHIVRIVHKPKRSHHKKSVPEKARVNLARPTIYVMAGETHVLTVNTPQALYQEANAMVAAGNPDAARLGLLFLREYRTAHKYWACV